MRRMYSENQLKEVVNKGIQSGDIEIPSGGTQLYSHSIHFGDYYFKCLSQKATAFTNVNDMVKNTISYYDAREFDPTSGYPVIMLGYDASALKMIYISGTTISQASGTDITDVVTPL